MKNKIFSWKGLKFNIYNKNVYPPKPASLLLADAAIKIIKPKEKILDVCTGSGIAAIAVAKFVHNVEVFASDINSEALSVTKENAKLNKVKVKMVLSDLYEKFYDEEFDTIVIHPPAVPYPPNKDWNMPKGMKIATNGGIDGSELVVRSIVEAKRCLKKNGKLLLLLPHWSNIKKAYEALQMNYAKISELATLNVDFFPAIEYDVDNKVLEHAFRLAKKRIIKIKFKNNKPYSMVSVVQAIKK